MSNIVGVMLAAGQSRRMGQPKQCLAWGTSTVAAASFDAVAPHCRHMIVTLGHAAESVLQALGDRQFARVHVDSDVEMLESIKAGLRAASLVENATCVLLHPADVPGVAASTVQSVVQQRLRTPDRAIMPEFDGRGGHPVLIPFSLIDDIIRFDESGGLRMFWKSHPHRRLRLPVRDSGCVHDLDTPDEYARAQQA